jgi:hypothetical protein
LYERALEVTSNWLHNSTMTDEECTTCP